MKIETMTVKSLETEADGFKLSDVDTWISSGSGLYSEVAFSYAGSYSLMLGL